MTPIQERDFRPDDNIEKVKMFSEIKRQTVKQLLIAAYCVGWEMGAKGYKLTNEQVKEHWSKLDELLTKETCQ